MTNYDKYLDPPDGEYAEYCDDCGQELEVKSRYHTIPNTLHCVNPFCPSKFFGTAKEMAEELVEARDNILTLESSNSYWKFHCDMQLAVINSLKAQISETAAKTAENDTE